MRIVKQISLKFEQADWVEKNKIDLSKLVQNAIDAEMLKQDKGKK